MITIEIETDSGAVSSDPGTEVARMLRKLADRWDGEQPDDTRLFDTNGNGVGKAVVQL